MKTNLLEKIAYTFPTGSIPRTEINSVVPSMQGYGIQATQVSPDAAHYLTNQQGLFGNYVSYERMPETAVTYRVDPITGNSVAIKSDFQDPHVFNAIGGAGLGGALGAGLGYLGAKNPADKKRNAIIGGVGGTAVGAAAGAASPEISHIKDSLVNSFGQNHIATNAILGTGLGAGLGEIYNRYSKETDAKKQMRNRIIGSLLGGSGLGAMGATY